MLRQTHENLGRSYCSVYGNNAKVGNRVIPMIFIGYAKNHAGNCYHMYIPTTGYMTEIRDIMWLHCMYYGKPEASDEVVMYPQVALPFKLEDAEAEESVKLNASEPKIESKDNEKEWSTVHTKLSWVVKPLELNMKEYSSDGVKGAISNICQNYSAQLFEPDDDKTKNIEIAAGGAGPGGRFNHTSELKVMKFK